MEMMWHASRRLRASILDRMGKVFVSLFTRVEQRHDA